MRRLLCGVSLLVLLAVTTPAFAVIIRLTALSEFIETGTYVVTATVDKFDAKRPSMVLKIDDKLKGKPAFDSMSVLLVGNPGAIKRKEPPELLERLDVKLPIVVFIKDDGDELTAYGYTNGTWFTMDGVKVEKEIRWSFANLEPYLRRTYKGTTKEMVQTVKDALANKKKPPAPNEKEKKGLGPKIEKKESKLDLDEKPQYGVVPTVLVGGPLVLLAMLFPTAFGGWRRWLVLLSTAGTNSTLYTLQWWFADSLAGTWLGSTTWLWAAMGVVNVLGVVWAWQRHLSLVQAGAAPGRPGWVETIVLLVVSAVGLGALVGLRLLDQKLFSNEWLPVVAFCVAVWIGCAYAIYARLRTPRMTPAVASEAVILAGLAIVSLMLGTTLTQKSMAGGLESAESRSGASVNVVWKFRLPAAGGILSSPLVHGERVYVAAAHDHAFRPYGILYCLERGTGKELWRFPDPKTKVRVKQIFSSPVVSEGKLYIGEGFHQDYDCKVYCLDASSGKLLWDFKTGNHTESTATVVDGKVYIGAGDDGLYCLDATKKAPPIWNFPSFHIDAPPRVVNGRVYAGCGIGDTYTTTAIFCLDATKKGQPIWRMNTPLPVWGKPVVSSGFVYVSCGNGRVNEGAERPAGEVLCLRDKDGDIVWSKQFSDGVLGSLAADRRHLFFGCRDKSLYCLKRADGSMIWRRDLGSPVVMTPALESWGEETRGGRLYAAGIDGYFACVDSQNGKLIWDRDLSSLANSAVEVIATPALESLRDADGSESWRIYVAATLISSGRVGELYCIEDRTHGGE